MGGHGHELGPQNTVEDRHTRGPARCVWTTETPQPDKGQPNRTHGLWLQEWLGVEGWRVGCGGEPNRRKVPVVAGIHPN